MLRSLPITPRRQVPQVRTQMLLLLRQRLLSNGTQTEKHRWKMSVTMLLKFTTRENWPVRFLISKIQQVTLWLKSKTVSTYSLMTPILLTNSCTPSLHSGICFLNKAICQKRMQIDLKKESQAYNREVISSKKLPNKQEKISKPNRMRTIEKQKMNPLDWESIVWRVTRKRQMHTLLFW